MQPLFFPIPIFPSFFLPYFPFPSPKCITVAVKMNVPTVAFPVQPPGPAAMTVPAVRSVTSRSSSPPISRPPNPRFPAAAATTNPPVAFSVQFPVSVSSIVWMGVGLWHQLKKRLSF